MYVNELTQDYGDEGRKAVEELLRRLAPKERPHRRDALLLGSGGDVARRLHSEHRDSAALEPLEQVPVVRGNLYDFALAR
jgi:hypothetical protein